MALAKLKIPGGIQADRTDYSTGPFWKSGNKVRFQQGQPEPVGGWETHSDFNTTVGTPSAIKAWRDLSDNDLLAIGTEKRLHVVKNGTIYDITPISSTVENTITFDTTNLSAVVNVNHTSHPVLAGDYVVIRNAAAVGGITPDGTYEVTEYIGANDFTITHSSAATSSVSGGGGAATDIDYLLPSGTALPTPGLGWGADTWNSGTWGDPASNSTITLDAAHWSFDLWGEDLIANRRGRGIYTWNASGGTGTRATAVTNAPTTNTWIQVSVPDRHLISFGAHDGSNADPMNIRWTTQEVNTTWTPSSTNTAGSQRLHLGDRLIASIQTKDQTLVWTNEALFGMLFSGDPFTFTFRPLSTGSEPLGQNAAVDQDGVVFWMGRDNFHVYTGREQVLPCPVRDAVYNDLNGDVSSNVFGGVNSSFTEIWWHYPSLASSDFPDKYVTYNWVTQEWALGSLGRVVWSEAESWLDKPFAYDSSGVFYFHEKGTNAAGSALNWSIYSGVLEVPEAGDQLFYVDRFVPDVEQQTGNITFTVYYRRYPNSTENSKTGTISTTTTKLNKRVRGRQLRFGYSSTEVDSFAKMGDLRADWKPDGRR